MYINPSFRPYEPHFHHLAFGECEKNLGVRAYLSFCEERGFNFEFSSFAIPSKFFKWENFYKCENSNFLFTLTFLLNPKHIFSNFKTFHSSNSHDTDSPTLWIAFTQFHLKLMKDISFSIETCFFMILHENLNLWIHVPNFGFWSNFHPPHIKLVVWPTCQVYQF